MEDWNRIEYKEDGGMQLYTVYRAWRTTTIYSIKSMGNYKHIQCKEHGGLQLYTYIQYKEHGGLQLYTV